MNRPLIVVGALVLGSLVFAGCKQDVGERCEQPSDCSSGYCSVDVTSAQGGVCMPPPTAAPPSDAATDGASDVGNGATDAAVTDGARDVAGEAETTDGGDGPAGDASSDLSSDRSSGDATTDLSGDASSDDSSTDASGDTSLDDGSVDAADAGSGG